MSGKSDAAVLFIDPKTAHNVAAALRACAIFGASTLRWTGKRVDEDSAWRRTGTSTKRRLPREERMKDYEGVDWGATRSAAPVDGFVAAAYVPVAVEVLDNAESLPDFVHPERALYVFGPEDGSIPRGIMTVCHRFVRIPSAHRTPLNLAAAVNLVLYDRFVKDGYFRVPQ